MSVVRPGKAFLELRFVAEQEDFPPDYWALVVAHLVSDPTHLYLPWPPDMVRPVGDNINLECAEYADVYVRTVSTLVNKSEIVTYMTAGEEDGSEMRLRLQMLLEMAEIGFLTEDRRSIADLLAGAGLPQSCQQYEAQGRVFPACRQK